MAINKVANKPSKSHAGLRNVIEYVLRNSKTSQDLVDVVGPYNKDIINYDNVYQAFIIEKKLWQKDNGRMYSHNIISFHKDEYITPQEALDFARDFSETWYHGYQALIAIHTDKEHIHAHIVVNTVSYIDGHKLHTCKQDLEDMKKFTNNMCIRRNLSIPEKGKDFYGNHKDINDTSIWSNNLYQLINNNPSQSYLVDCISNIQATCQTACSQEEFISKMAESGWNVEWNNRKHIVFKNEEGQKVRDSHLTKTFNLTIDKEHLETIFNANEEQIKNHNHNSSKTHSHRRH